MYTVSPTLPAGLVIDAKTGSISGKPTTVSQRIEYTITVSDSVSEKSTKIYITVTDTTPPPKTYKISGTHTNSTGAVLYLNDTESLTLGTSTNFQFAAGLFDQASYKITIKTYPNGKNCTIIGGEGSIQGVDISNVKVECTDISYLQVNSSNPIKDSHVDAGTKDILLTFSEPISTVDSSKILAKQNGSIISLNSSINNNVLKLSYPTGFTGQAFIELSIGKDAITSTKGNKLKEDYTLNFYVKKEYIPISSLAYTIENVEYTKGEPISNNLAKVTGGNGSYTYMVAPQLPNGLSIGNSTGTISGTPSVSLSKTEYTVGVTDQITSFNKKIYITVKEPVIKPFSLSYTPSVKEFKYDMAESITPSVSGSQPITYSINPALPTGLSIDTSTGKISSNGNTGYFSQTKYTITATNSVGSTSSNVDLSGFVCHPDSYQTRNYYIETYDKENRASIEIRYCNGKDYDPWKGRLITTITNAFPNELLESVKKEPSLKVLIVPDILAFCLQIAMPKPDNSRLTCPNKIEVFAIYANGSLTKYYKEDPSTWGTRVYSQRWEKDSIPRFCLNPGSNDVSYLRFRSESLDGCNGGSKAWTELTVKSYMVK